MIMKNRKWREWIYRVTKLSFVLFMKRYIRLIDFFTLSFICLFFPPLLASLHQVLGTPHALSLLNILQSMVLVERGSKQSDVVWPLLEDLTTSCVMLQDGDTRGQVRSAGLEKIKKAVKEVKNAPAAAAGMSFQPVVCY